MSIIDRIETALVLAPHPDDEILGCGGVIARLVDNSKAVDVAIVTRGMAPAYAVDQVEQLVAEAKASHTFLGVRHSHFLDLPAAALDQVPRAELNAAVSKVVLEVKPDTIFVPFVGDIHIDHQLVFSAAMVASRPTGGFRPCRILAYETVSETNWDAPFLTPSFVPNIFISIDGYLETKIAAFEKVASQVKQFPNERSSRALRALAEFRGATVHVSAAEAFVLVREING